MGKKEKEEKRVLGYINEIKELSNEPPITIEQLRQSQKDHTFVLQEPIRPTLCGESISIKDVGNRLNHTAGVMIPPKYIEDINGDTPKNPMLYVPWMSESGRCDFFPVSNVRIARIIKKGVKLIFLDRMDLSYSHSDKI